MALLHDVVVVVAVIEGKIAVCGQRAIERPNQRVVVDDAGLVDDAEAGKQKRKQEENAEVHRNLNIVPR